MDQNYQEQCEELDRLWLKYKGPMTDEEKEKYHEVVYLKYPLNPLSNIRDYITAYANTISNDIYHNSIMAEALLDHIKHIVRNGLYCDGTTINVDHREAYDLYAYMNQRLSSFSSVWKPKAYSLERIINSVITKKQRRWKLSKIEPMLNETPLCYDAQNLVMSYA